MIRTNALRPPSAQRTITAACVSIQMLSLGAQSMTIPILHQLPYRSLVHWVNIMQSSCWERHLCGDFSPSRFYPGSCEMYTGENLLREMLNGTPWGHVNVWWDGCFTGEDIHGNEPFLPGDADCPIMAREEDISRCRRRHIVWEQGGIISRAVVGERIPMGAMQMFYDEGKQMEWSHLACFWRAALWPMVCGLPQLFVAGQ